MNNINRHLDTIIDHAKRGKLGATQRNSQVCAYTDWRDPEKHCAIGCLLTKTEQKALLNSHDNGTNVYDMFSEHREIKQRLGLSYSDAHILQRLHDSHHTDPYLLAAKLVSLRQGEPITLKLNTNYYSPEESSFEFSNDNKLKLKEQP